MVNSSFRRHLHAHTRRAHRAVPCVSTWVVAVRGRVSACRFAPYSTTVRLSMYMCVSVCGFSELAHEMCYLKIHQKISQRLVCVCARLHALDRMRARIFARRRRFSVHTHLCAHARLDDKSFIVIQSVYIIFICASPPPPPPQSQLHTHRQRSSRAHTHKPIAQQDRAIDTRTQRCVRAHTAPHKNQLVVNAELNKLLQLIYKINYVFFFCLCAWNTHVHMCTHAQMQHVRG